MILFLRYLFFISLRFEKSDLPHVAYVKNLICKVESERSEILYVIQEFDLSEVL